MLFIFVFYWVLLLYDVDYIVINILFFFNIIDINIKLISQSTLLHNIKIKFRFSS